MGKTSSSGSTLHKRVKLSGAASKAAKSQKFRRTPYRPGETSTPPKIRLGRLPDDYDFPDVFKLSEAQSKKLVRELGFLPSVHMQGRRCWKCGDKLRPVRKKDDKSGKTQHYGRCENQECDRPLVHPEAYTPVHNRGCGGAPTGDAGTLTKQESLRSA